MCRAPSGLGSSGHQHEEDRGTCGYKQTQAAFLDARIVIVTVCKGDDMREAADEGGASAFVVKGDLLELGRF